MNKCAKIVWIFVFVFFIANQQSFAQAKKDVIDSLTVNIKNLKSSIEQINSKLNYLTSKIELLETSDSMLTVKKTNWRKLKRYMSITEVKKLLGKPTSIDNSASSIRFWYGTGYIDFNAFKKVSSWSEPRKNRLEIIEH